MPARYIFRLRDIIDYAGHIEMLLSGKTLADVRADLLTRAAFERFLEIISEASRHVPSELKEAEAELPWRRIADLGNILRHAYPNVDVAVLWDIYESGELRKLALVAAALISASERS